MSSTLHEEPLIQEFINHSSTILEAYENREFSKAIREIMDLADKANQYIDKMEPWNLIKEEKNKELVQSICTTSLNLFRLLTIMLNPVIPDLCSRIYSFLKVDEPAWNEMDKLLTSHEIDIYKPLLIRIEKEQIENIILRSKEV